MNKTGDFVKTTTVGGLIALAPLAAIAFILWTVFSILVDVTQALKDVLPFNPWINTLLVTLAAVVLLLLLSFAAGLLLRTVVGAAVRNKADSLLGKAVPIYRMVQSIAERMAGMKGTDFAPVEVDLYGNDTRVLGVLTDTLPNDRYSVFVPMVPAATVGQLYIVPSHRVRLLKVAMGEAMAAVTQFGVGTAKLYSRPAISPDEVAEPAP